MSGLKRNWGFSFFCLLSLLGLFRLLFAEEVWGHYIIFTEAARLLALGQDAYGSDLGSGVGYWVYSPNCALLFYWFFQIFPPWLGITLYSMISWAMYTYGAIALNRALFPNAEPLTPTPKHHWFWVVLASHMMIALIASKTEIFMTGVIFVSAAWLIEDRKKTWAALLLAMIFTWKFQPLPTIGLITTVLLLKRRDFSFLGAFLGFSVLWALSPLLFLSWEQMAFAYSRWIETLDPIVKTFHLSYDTVYRFLHQVLGVELDYVGVRWTSLLFGMTFFSYVLFFGLRQKSEAASLVFALSLGAAFSSSLSPLNQNNSYVIYGPLVLGWIYFMTQNKGSKPLEYGFYVLVAVVTLAYSDLMPIRESLRGIALKPITVLTASVFFGAYILANRAKDLTVSSR